MARSRPLPLADEWEDPDSYIEALLSFATSSVLFMNLCGGVHILEFITREPDLYTTLLPDDWRAFFAQHDIHDIIHLLLREDIGPLREREHTIKNSSDNGRVWNGGAFPPQSLLDYIHNIRRLSFRREFTNGSLQKAKLPRHVAVGMNRKKAHEVEHFSRYVAALTDTVAERRGEPISHIVDFGSGQNYLGRTLVSAPYHKHVIAIERQHGNISGAQSMDVSARLAKKPKTVYVHHRQKSCSDCNETPNGMASVKTEETPLPGVKERSDGDARPQGNGAIEEDVTIFKMLGDIKLEADELLGSMSRYPDKAPKHKQYPEVDNRGTISYIEHDIQDGYLEPIIDHVVRPSPATTPNGDTSEDSSITVETEEQEQGYNDARVMVVSLHSCGNLVHHGVRSLVLNPSVVAVAMIGCCYNMMTERLGPATYKIPILRSLHPRLTETGHAYDPHGFPMSKLYERYQSPVAKGIKLNITARSMSVQAPYNWGYADSEGFFTRHYFRALLQRILVDRGVLPKPTTPKNLYGEDQNDPLDGIPPIIIGALRKTAFESFTAYVRAATVKMSRDPHHGPTVLERVASLTDEEIRRYESDYHYARKNLSVVWSLMAFSAQVVEAIIVVDRWQFLREHDSVKECWVEPVFDYSQSPRNLAVIGLKK